MNRFGYFSIITILLSACVWTPSHFPSTYESPPPSRTPAVRSPTPVYISPTGSVTLTLTPSLTPDLAAETTTPTPKITLTANILPFLELTIVGCNTSLDISHQMGEVTNAYVILGNRGNTTLTNACATLYAIDEGRQHPDKTVCAPELPIRTQVTLKLTVDTQFKADTSIRIEAITAEGATARAEKESCREIGLFQGNPGELGVVKPIP